MSSLFEKKSQSSFIEENIEEIDEEKIEKAPILKYQSLGTFHLENEGEKDNLSQRICSVKIFKDNLIMGTKQGQFFQLPIDDFAKFQPKIKGDSLLIDFSIDDQNLNIATCFANGNLKTEKRKRQFFSFNFL
eukprot:Anaeramoba_ignava/c20215_g1_i5.p2 GENE.c20215_g1_i5~~c20215_g1_i5.p2  ORF type:complete len:132 (-),score=53.26 c20215_g1_i5:2481-2876(-)